MRGTNGKKETAWNSAGGSTRLKEGMSSKKQLLYTFGRVKVNQVQTERKDNVEKNLQSCKETWRDNERKDMDGREGQISVLL